MIWGIPKICKQANQVSSSLHEVWCQLGLLQLLHMLSSSLSLKGNETSSKSFPLLSARISDLSFASAISSSIPFHEGQDLSIATTRLLETHACSTQLALHKDFEATIAQSTWNLKSDNIGIKRSLHIASSAKLSTSENPYPSKEQKCWVFGRCRCSTSGHGKEDSKILMRPGPLDHYVMHSGSFVQNPD